jgi:transposase-like protein
MVAVALEALVGSDPADEAVEAALATIPGSELEAALRWLARQHGVAALPILRRCLADRPERAIAAAQALGTLPLPEAADALEATETRAASKAVRTAARRALYRLRQAGVDRRAPASPPAAPRIGLGEAWMSAVDGTGGRGLWLTLVGPYGERTLLAAMLSDETGLLDFSAGAMPKKRVEERLRALRAESPLPWVSVPPSWAWAILAAAADRAHATGGAVPAELERWIERLGAPAAEPPPIHTRLPPTATEDPALLERSAALLALPELTGWFLDPSSVSSEGLEWLQARESRLVVSDQIKAERLAALVDRIIETRFDAPARRLWQGRLEEQAYVLLALGRETDAASAVAVARALATGGDTLRRIPFLRALVERSLEVAGEVATGRLSAAAASRAPRAPAAHARGG